MIAMNDPQPAIAPTVRRARSDDASAMAELVRAAYRPYIERMGTEPAPMTDEYAKVIREEEEWVAECAERLVGLLVLQAQPDHLLLENVAVSPDSQKLGIGRLLLDLADRRAWELRFSEVRLYTNVAMTENLAYYPRHGYHETRRATQDGFQRVFFTKPLQAG